MSKQERIKSFKDLCAKYAAEEKLKGQWAQTHFGKKFTQLSFEDRWKLTAEANILGSISIGEYGFGHPSETYVMDFYREAFANMYLARKYHWTDICEKYPNIMKYLEEKIK